MIRCFAAAGCWAILAGSLLHAAPPRATDPGITVELFAENPEIVTPTGLAVHPDGRVFVAESHTHFRPDDYPGPAADRILIFQDEDGDGRADRRTIFHEGFVHVMDIEFHRDGSLYVATRRDIHRMRDTNGDGKADEVKLLVKLETKGNYPHNGLSGIAFDVTGAFHFGLGENLGEPYALIGSDGVQLAGGGEGGSTYYVQADGSQLRRISTGWWNPYGLCTDSFGRVFGTDNDPDSSPPCRLIQVVEGGDYGYEFRYGRSGRNPLITWDGEIPGTLPMVAGTGEAPCHAVVYEASALPSEFVGNVLIPSWADHRVERYKLVQRADRGLVETKRQPFIEGGDDFRPVGIDVAPDGTIYITDWVSSSYTLHQLGRVWRIRPTQPRAPADADSVAERSVHPDRQTREAASLELTQSDSGKQQLEANALHAKLPQARATALALLPPDSSVLDEVVRDERASLEVRLTAATRLAQRDAGKPTGWQDERLPVPIRAALLERTRVPDIAEMARVTAHPDDWLRHAAIGALARSLDADTPKTEAIGELPYLLALRRAGQRTPAVDAALQRAVTSADPAVRFTAVKWIADERLVAFKPQLEQLLRAATLDVRTFLGLHVALDRLADKKVTDRPTAEVLTATAFDATASASLRRMCLRLLDPTTPPIPLAKIAPLTTHEDDGLRLEAVRLLSRHPDSGRATLLLQIAKDESQPSPIRAEAVAGLATLAEAHTESLVAWATNSDVAVQAEALRALVGTPLTESQRKKLEEVGTSTELREAVARVTGGTPEPRPDARDLAPWLTLVSREGNAAAGERVFLGAKVGKCSSCHQFEGLGAAVGPDLSTMHRRVAAGGEEGRRWLLETILQPSRDMAPQFTPWQIVTVDGKQHLGLPRRKGGTSEAYLGIDGREFSLKTTEIESHQEARVSIMPENLLQQLTRQELADLFAFLTASGG